MAKKYLADAVALDNAWTRKARGKLEASEVLRAKSLADEDVKQYLRQLYGSSSLSKDDMSQVQDADGDPVDVAKVVIDDLFHKDVNEELDRLDNPSYVRLVDIADLIASLYIVMWTDFLGGQEDVDGGTGRSKTIGNAIRRMKVELERVGYLETTEDAEGGAVKYYFQRTFSRPDGFNVGTRYRG